MLFTVSWLGSFGDSYVDSTDYTSFKPGDFSRRGLDNDVTFPHRPQHIRLQRRRRRPRLQDARDRVHLQPRPSRLPEVTVPRAKPPETLAARQRGLTEEVLETAREGFGERYWIIQALR
jgi:hypothetical protein